jgi:CHAT domain-containing protein
MSRAESQAPQLPEDDQSLKQSPIADLMNRRLKAMTKKSYLHFYSKSFQLILIAQARVSTYAATDIEKLNDDQVRSLKNLPTLEAIHKEIGEVKKAIEVCQSRIEKLFRISLSFFSGTRARTGSGSCCQAP